MPSVIQVDQLQKSYGATLAVRDVSFRVQRGEIFGILGPNGAGKTTTVECIQALRRRTGGTVRILGMDPEKESEKVRGRTGAQLQASALPARIRVREALDLFAALAHRSESPETLLRDWGLEGVAKAPFHTLSGGERQRLLVALALVNKPDVVFLDEMTTGLDPEARQVAWGLIEKIRARGTTIILVTHDMEEARRLCDRLAIIVQGRLVALDTPARIMGGAGSGVQVEFTFNAARDLRWLRRIQHVARVERKGRRVTVRGDGNVAQRVAHALLEHGIEAPDFRTRAPSLEEAYLRLTQEATP